MKKIKSLVILNIIIMTITITIIITSLTNITIQPTGDVDQDGQVTMIDIIMTKRYILSGNDFSKQQQKLADMNHDLAVDDKDLQIMKAYVLYE